MDRSASILLKNLLKQRRMSIEDLVKLTGIPRPTVSRHVRGKTFPKMEDRAKYALALDMTSKQFEQAWQSISNEQVATTEKLFELETPAPIDPNVDPVTVETIRVPEFDLRIAAGPWIDIGDEAAMPDNSYAVVQGRFRVRIRGDSMEPRWPDGSMVEFRRIVLGREHVPFGEDCYVQTSDGRATFKRLESGDEDQFVLRAVNTGKYPKKMTVAVQEVVNIAVAEAMVVVPKK